MFSPRQLLFVVLSRRVVVARVWSVVRSPGPHSSAKPLASSVGHRRQAASNRRVPRLSSPADYSNAPALACRAADAAQTAADVFVDEAESGGHYWAEVRDGEKRQRNSEYRVDDGDHLAPRGLRRDVPIPCKHSSLDLIGIITIIIAAETIDTTVLIFFMRWVGDWVLQLLSGVGRPLSLDQPSGIRFQMSWDETENTLRQSLKTLLFRQY